MKISDVYNAIDRIAPFELACEWDNCGLICGDPGADVTRVFFTLDPDLAALKAAKERGCELVISHHPLIFDPLRAVTPREPVYHYVRAGIAVISAHTNLDAADGGVNDELAKLTRIERPEKLYSEGAALGRYGKTGFEGSAEEYVGMLCSELETRAQFVLSRPVKNVCVVSGSGGSLLEAAYGHGCDTLVTGECRHSHFVQAENLGMNLVALGHFETENVILKPLAKRLKKELPELETAVSERRHACERR